MRWFDRFRMTVLMLFRRGRETELLNDELQFHLEQQVLENVSNGMSPEEARFAAMRQFGNPTLIREEARSVWSWNWLEQTVRDLRYGARTLGRSPGFALIAIVVMALGIGTTTSLFTIVRAVLLRPLPFRDPGKLVMVYEHFRVDTQGDGLNAVSSGDFHSWRDETHGFQEMAAWRQYGFNLTGEHSELPEVVQASGGSWNLLSVLGVKPALGRSFTQAEDLPNANHVVMLTWSLFQRRFGGDPSVLGKSVRLDTTAYTIVGVLPRWFTYPDPKIQVWVPYGQTFPADRFEVRDDHQTMVVARLRPGVSAATATKEVSALQYRLHEANASKPVAEDAVFRPMIDDVVQDVKTPLLVLMFAVGCMLLIACLNVSNLLVARSAARRKEIAVRGALGGSRWTLVREQMAESLLICVAGGTVGLAISILATRWLAGHWQALPRAETIGVDVDVLGFSVGLIFLTALLAGLLPAISSTGSGVLAGLQESSRSVGGSASRASLRKVLLTTEIALTVILLVSAGLLFKSFVHLRTADLGCVTDHVLTVKYGLPEKQYDTRGKILAFHEALLQRVRSLPGVRGASLVSIPPGGGKEGDSTFTIPERPSSVFNMQEDAIISMVDPSYFSTMKIPLLSGRFFTDQERLTRDHYVIINKKLANNFFPGESPLGKHLRVGLGPMPVDYEIVGVVGNTLHRVTRPVLETMYFPIFSGMTNLATDATIVVRTAPDPLTLALPVQRQVAVLDPGMPVYDVLTMEQIIGNSTASQSFSATLILSFAGLSLLLAAIGLYGVLSYLVTQRVTEIGIRIALGAQREQVLWLVLADGLRPVAIGLVLGLAGGATVGALIRSILYGTSPFDPMVFATMIGGLLLTALIACAVPAIRASRIEPMQALRSE
jgi:predicted permease